MRDRTIVIGQIINEKIKIGEEILNRFYYLSIKDKKIQPDYISWYLSSLEILKINNASFLNEFSLRYQHVLEFLYPSPFGTNEEIRQEAITALMYQVDLLASLPSVIDASYCSIYSVLSSGFSLDEIEQAKELYDKGYVRAAGSVAGVALERHVKTLVEVKDLEVEKHPPQKPNTDFSDYINTLKKHDVIDDTIKKFLEYLFRIRKTCSHPEEPKQEEVQKLIFDVAEFIQKYR